ncbi:MAG: CYTH domain-containing protein [Burkholderiales bacterium]|jgi:adenylate cyclase|nr:CYTH domain-containing protein [Burkholderiales bacterium]
MGVEIERKFLVKGSDWRTKAGTTIGQGYLNRDKNRTVRVRIAGEEAFLTIKGPSVGPSRLEFEYAIPTPDAMALLQLCEGTPISKTRHVVIFGGMKWEIDEFHGANDGLVVAEIELDSEDQQFSRPDWVDREVTDDPKFFNSNLIEHPFSTWR